MFTLCSPGPSLLHSGAVDITWYGALTFTGCLVSILLASFMARVRGLSIDSFIACALTSLIGGLIGARLYFVVLNFSHFLMHPQEIFSSWRMGRSIQGGFVIGSIFGWLYCRIARFDFLKASDIVGVVHPLGQAIGRFGNFFNDEAFGWPVSREFPIRLYLPPANRPLGCNDQPFYHPTFLYESTWCLFSFILLYFMWTRLGKRPGFLYPMHLILYSIGRMLIEPLRMDSVMFGSMPAATVASVALVFVAVVWGLIVMRLTRHRAQNQRKEHAGVRSELVMANSGSGQ